MAADRHDDPGNRRREQLNGVSAWRTAAATRAEGADLETVCAHLANGALRPLITQMFPLSRRAEAIAAFEAGHKQGKVVLTAGQA